ncbi:MAG TPA: DinB family protein [Gemmatimonadales bacterium]|nr:DinB family protein [Gemmatimonadales bacterium]
MTARPPEAWLRGPVDGIAPVLQPAAHALIQASEELAAAVAGLPVATVWAGPGGVASIGFHLRHIAASTDRLLAYARGAPLSAEQLRELAEEKAPGTPPAEAPALLAHAHARMHAALDAYRAVDNGILFEPRTVGRKRLPTTVFGLLAHIGEHAMRHTGQVVTTAGIMRAQRLD